MVTLLESKRGDRLSPLFPRISNLSRHVLSRLSTYSLSQAYTYLHTWVILLQIEHLSDRHLFDLTETFFTDSMSKKKRYVSEEFFFICIFSIIQVIEHLRMASFLAWRLIFINPQVRIFKSYKIFTNCTFVAEGLNCKKKIFFTKNTNKFILLLTI